jgi:phosphoglycerate dehydrogenase-like enzyme
VNDGRAQRPAILCSPVIAAEYGDRLRSISPDHDLVLVGHGAEPSEADLARVEIGFFSGDLFPDHVREFFGAATRATATRWFHTMSAGVDSPVFGRIRDAGARLTTSSGAAAPAIARTVAMYLLALSRDLRGLTRSQAAHHWDYRPYDDLDGKRIGVVGMGPIGLDVIRLAVALGMEPIGMRRRALGDEPCETWSLERFGELTASVDALVLALPLTPETGGLLTRELIDGMRPGALFVNVGRGELVDEDALADALARGHLGGAGLDVFQTEPLPADSPFWDLPNVIVTPHNSGTTPGSPARAVEIFVANLAAYLAGEPMRNEVVG